MRRRGRLLTAIGITVVLLFCGGGGVSAYLLLRDADGQGAEDPTTAAISFLEAVYTDRDATRAGRLVCAEARDSTALTRKIEEIEGYATRYPEPRFEWELPRVDRQSGDRAVVSTTVTVITADERVARQRIILTVVRKTGWRVCEVEQR